MRSAKISRRETIFIGGLVASVAAGYAVQHAITTLSEIQKRDWIDEQTITVRPNETSAIDDGPWDGHLEITLTRSTWYDSFKSALQHEELGDISPYASVGNENPETGGYIVCELIIHNVDASFYFYEPDYLNTSVFALTCTDGTRILPESVRSSRQKWDDERGDLYATQLQMEDTVEILLGYPLPTDITFNEIVLGVTGSLTQFLLDIS